MSDCINLPVLLTILGVMFGLLLLILLIGRRVGQSRPVTLPASAVSKLNREERLDYQFPAYSAPEPDLFSSPLLPERSEKR
jgi:hypothetical protein